MTSPVAPSLARPAPDTTSTPFLSFALLVAAGILVLHPLSQTWSYNPNYSFGWGIPIAAFFLFVERWATRPPRAASGGGLLPMAWLIVIGLVFAAFRVSVETDSDWRPGLWLLVGLYVATWLGWLRIYGGAPWMRHFAFPICFLFLSLPWFFGIEYPLTQDLMRLNTILAAGSLDLLGILARPSGNVIQMEHCQLGVEEACSGMLSLQASLMFGCLLGEIYHHTLKSRLILVASSLGFALLGNYLRTTSLALVAYSSGTQAVTAWHDTAGFSILVFTGVSAWLTALSLPAYPLKGPSIRTAEVEQPSQVRSARVALRLAVTVFVITAVTEAGIQVWFGWKEAGLPSRPVWSANFFGAQEIIVPKVTQETLFCDEARAAKWKDAQGGEWMAYWFRFLPKSYNRVSLGWHNPDHCLPSMGLTKDRDFPDFQAQINGLDLDVRPKRFVAGDASIYLFWIVYANRGELPPDLAQASEAGVWTKFRFHFHDIVNGFRGLGVETLEMAVTGPGNYEAAKADYLGQLKEIVRPGDAPAGR